MLYKPMALQFPPDAHETEVTAAASPGPSGGMTALTARHMPPVSVSNTGFPEGGLRPPSS
jgi:hypothetical protein